jgi:spermidine synthase
LSPFPKPSAGINPHWIARRFFSLPLEPRLKIKIADGAHYIKQQSLQSPRQHDFILLDAFDHAGMADTVQGINFLKYVWHLKYS